MKNVNTVKKILPKLLKILIFSTVPIFFVLIFYIYSNFSNTLQDLSQTVIYKTTKKVELQLNLLINPIKENLKITRDRLKSQNNIGMDKYEWNKYFIPFLKNTKQCSSLLLANSFGDEYMLLQEDSTWQNRITVVNNGQNQVNRYRWSYNDDNHKFRLIKNWQLKSDTSNNPINKPWFTSAVAKNGDDFGWTDLYLFKTTKDPGITVSLSWKTEKNNKNISYVVAYDIMLKEISKYVSNMKISKNGKVAIFSGKGKIIGLPKDNKFNNKDSIKANLLKEVWKIDIPYLKEAYKTWRNNKEQELPFAYNIEDEKWWGAIKKINLNSNHIIYIVVMVPEKDFLAEIDNTKHIIIISLFIFLLLMIVVISGYNEKRKINILLEKQKHEISEKNEELYQQNEEIIAQRDEIVSQKNKIELIHSEVSKSIDYAKRLQQTILSSEEILKLYISDHFVFFHPKDKVSGDFYWWANMENHTVITVADCTGHGVPGAFMSMLGASLLREIVQKEYITHTGVILRRLRKEIIKSLKQKGKSGEQKDGMDMAIISIDHQTNIVQFSGANNPLYLITNSELRILNENNKVIKFYDNSTFKIQHSKLLYEIKPDKMPVAIYERMDKFATHEIQLEKGDQLYMFSDGFADQFGGPKGKKFKYKPFKQLIIDNCQLSMADQKTVLEKTFAEWKGNLEQVDDVTVLGVKI